MGCDASTGLRKHDRTGRGDGQCGRLVDARRKAAQSVLFAEPAARGVQPAAVSAARWRQRAADIFTGGSGEILGAAAAAGLELHGPDRGLAAVRGSLPAALRDGVESALPGADRTLASR